MKFAKIIAKKHLKIDCSYFLLMRGIFNSETNFRYKDFPRLGKNQLRIEILGKNSHQN